jgi:carboxypeptidase T
MKVRETFRWGCGAASAAASCAVRRHAGGCLRRSHLAPLLACLISLAATASSPAADFLDVGLYGSFDELVSWTSDFAAANPDIVRVVEFGRSHQDRPLISLQLTVQPGVNDPTKPEFLFTGGVHAREVIGSEAAYRLAEHLVDGYRSGDPVFHDMLTQREIWIVPNLNPDGRVRVEEGLSEHRKTMELLPGQAADNSTRGVDLNRNFPHRWFAASSSASAATYRGPSVLSTPEASALWSLLHDTDHFSDLRASIDFHSGAEAVLAPWISPREFSDYPLPASDLAVFDSLATEMGQLTGLGTRRLGYNSYGTLVDSLYEEFGTYSFLEELYVGSFPDFFTRFNPTDPVLLEETVEKAIVAAEFLLSDAAFMLVPEPATWLLIATGGALLMARARQKRRR